VSFKVCISSNKLPPDTADSQITRHIPVNTTRPLRGSTVDLLALSSSQRVSQRV